MEGFFTIKETESKTRPDGKIYSCASCGLYRKCKHPKMKPTGNFNKGILNIGSINSFMDDQRGKQWQGTDGHFLANAYAKLGIDLFDDCLNVNAINCFPGDKDVNPDLYVASCRASIIKIIEEYKPSVIMLFGVNAIDSVIGHRWKKDLGDINKWRGWTIPDKDFRAWICPVFHPKDVEEASREVNTIWKADLENGLSKILKKVPKYVEPTINIIEDLKPLTKIKSDIIAFDYETTGIKPHAKGHRIVCCSVAIDENNVFVFMMPASKSERKPFTDLLGNNLISKMAHNMKFEDNWSTVRLRQKVNNWQWDSMIAAHILDNRQGITGLKFQSYVNFGIVDYDSEIAPYLHAEDKDGNAFNTIDKLLAIPGGQEKLLTYCAYDSVYEYRLAMRQIKIMDYSFLPF